MGEGLQLMGGGTSLINSLCLSPPPSPSLPLPLPMEVTWSKKLRSPSTYNVPPAALAINIERTSRLRLNIPPPTPNSSHGLHNILLVASRTRSSLPPPPPYYSPLPKHRPGTESTKSVRNPARGRLREQATAALSLLGSARGIPPDLSLETDHLL